MRKCFIIKREQTNRASKPIDEELVAELKKNGNINTIIPYYSDLVNIKHKNLKDSLN